MTANPRSWVGQGVGDRHSTEVPLGTTEPRGNGKGGHFDRILTGQCGLVRQDWASALATAAPRPGRLAVLMEETRMTSQRKWYSLVDKVWNPANLALAAAAVLANQGAAGVDHQSCDQFAEHLGDELDRLGRAMWEHRYKPLPVRRVWIPKPGTTKQRPLGVPAIRDRVAEEAMRRVMEPIWEPTFSPDRYGFRPGRSAHEAVNRIFDHLSHGYHWVVDADIRDYFGSIDQQLLIDKVAERISDGTVLGWIRDMLRAGVMDAGQWQSTLRGTSQGSVISPLLANIYLDALDQAMATLPGIQFIRYADDWCALAHIKEEAEAALTTARKVLDELRLTLHPEKTRIVDIRDSAFDFLGFTFFWVVSKDGTGRPPFRSETDGN